MYLIIIFRSAKVVNDFENQSVLKNICAYFLVMCKYVIYFFIKKRSLVFLQLSDAKRNFFYIFVGR